MAMKAPTNAFPIPVSGDAYLEVSFGNNNGAVILGDNAHAEGNYSVAFGSCTHATGYSGCVYTNYGGSEEYLTFGDGEESFDPYDDPYNQNTEESYIDYLGIKRAEEKNEIVGLQKDREESLKSSGFIGVLEV